MKIGVIIQARMGSARLPGKVMKEVEDKPILDHVITRVKQSKYVDKIIIATTSDEKDNCIEKLSLKCGVSVFRGNEFDVLSRYYYAAEENHIDVVVRVTSDCPLIDPKILDKMIEFYLNKDYEIVSNAGSDTSQRTYPRGLDVEIFSYEALKKSHMEAKEAYQREHVTPYIYENSDKVFYYKNDVDFSHHRWTLDTKEDFSLINKIYQRLYQGQHDFYMSDIIELFNNDHSLYKINQHVEQKKMR
ncbi:cytidylyltransferase domain-containing protein [Amphibacillus jilinensis]|uniref:cytidylyltransferase domain-containing protein n=1 Tax=Amphibacillus jilinensis TaxID=1216008 RepID=UPI0002F9AFBB|nr:glycosyltransferase family protein [Amphibacillus jilinensis]